MQRLTITTADPEERLDQIEAFAESISEPGMQIVQFEIVERDETIAVWACDLTARAVDWTPHFDENNNPDTPRPEGGRYPLVRLEES